MAYGFLVPLILGFAFDAASAFTSAFSRRWGVTGGRLASAILRNVLGVPVWVVGLGCAIRSPSPRLVAETALLTALGWLLLVVGCAVQLLALRALRLPAAAPSQHDALVASGVYGYVRHPIYAGLLVQFLALVLVKPRGAIALASALGVGWVHLQARLEELDLLQRMPAYREYMRRVPRFVPARPARPRP
jgi:protein-S-isoprenylcysteine O-methyltransferase Ste14